MSLLLSGSAALAQHGALHVQVKDETGAVVQNASLSLRSSGGAPVLEQRTGGAGDFEFNALSPGDYVLRVGGPGFSSVSFAVRVGRDATLWEEITLHPAPVTERVQVDEGITPAAESHRVPDAMRLKRSAAQVLQEAAGIDVRANGTLAAIPVIHGLGDDRVKVEINGTTVSAACPNHMNAPLSYTSPETIERLTVIAGVAPVSLGGDSVGGVIRIDPADPVFAETAGGGVRDIQADGFYGSNGQAYGGTVRLWAASHNFGAGYTGAWSSVDDYADGAGRTVTSTYAQTTVHSFLLAARRRNNLLTLAAAIHHTPYEGFVGAEMDMTRNLAYSGVLRWRHAGARDGFDARLYWQAESHNMNVGHDKSRLPMPMVMPMNTHGVDAGYGIDYWRRVGARTMLRAGNELHRFTLNDTWPAVAGTAPMMGPGAFISIHDGHRLRSGTYAEIAAIWGPHWSTTFGGRNDTVWMNSGPVAGYSMMYQADADAFNSAKRAHTDVNFAVSAQARYQPRATLELELGYGHSMRSPNVYERYAWSRDWMASGMIGWFNDGNHYVGDPALRPEANDAASVALTVRHAGSHAGSLRLAPYFNYLSDSIDVRLLASQRSGMADIAQLQFTNLDARTYGGDLEGRLSLWGDEAQGGMLRVSGGWVRGDRIHGRTPLYQMMPLHGTASIREEIRGLHAQAELVAVDRKRHVDPLRREPQTPGFVLLGIGGGYHRGLFDFNVSGNNLFDRLYRQPLGGVNYDNFLAGMSMGPLEPLTGPGRSVSLRLKATF